MSNETKVLIGIGLATLVIVIAATFLIGGKQTSTAQNTEPVTNAEALVRGDSHFVGPKNAKVTVVEFADFQCPGCAAAHPVVQQLQGEYKDKVKFVFRNFPLEMHKNSKVAAEAAEAAGEQGKFSEMEAKLFEGQKDWENSNNALEVFAQYAKELKLDVEKFKKDVTANKYAKKIEADQKDGFAVGVNATPTFYINGVKQEGGIDYKAYKEQFDKLLNN